MQNNYYFLRQVSARLQEQLAGFTLVSCFSQEKDEIVCEFNDAKRSFFIRADLQGDFSCLTFPEIFRRARKNSVDLFDEIIMKKVIGVRQFLNERSFSILLEDELSIVFKMHGNKSNVVLIKADEEIDRFKNNIPGGMATDRQIDWSRDAFDKNIDHPERLYFTFGKGLLKKDWDHIQKTKRLLEEPQYYIIRKDHKIGFSLILTDTVLETFTDPLKAINAFYSLYTSTHSFEKEKHTLVSRHRTDIQQTQSWIEKTSAKMNELRSDSHYKSWGDLLMANLHAAGPGQTSVDLDDFYHPGKKVTIRLDAQLSPQKNAERYYRKGKNQQIEITKLGESLEARSKELSKLQGELANIESTTDIKTLRTKSPEAKREVEKEAIPFWQFEFKGFTVWVGKDAKNNDELTTKWAHKNDLWLHVRDVPGSHVIIRHKAGKPFPKDVIEFAAAVAAYNSKRKTESLAPVIVTPKKFVRKRKGDPAGMVVVDREEVILVVPQAPTRN